MVIVSNKLDTVDGLTHSTPYQVVAIYFDLYKQKVSYNIIDDYGRLAYYSADYFSSNITKVDEDWVLKMLSTQSYALLPELLSYDGFYEDFHNDDLFARERFKMRYPELAIKLG